MGWLIAIVCIILAVVFWRIFLPLAIVAAVGSVLLLLHLSHQRNTEERRRLEAERSTKQRLARAESTSDTVHRAWEVSLEIDPSTGREAPRHASVLSDHELCRLQVEERIDRTRLTGIYCPGFKISPYTDVQVKFDNHATSDPMRLQHFSDYQDVYIPAYQYSDNLNYDTFLYRLTRSSRLALRLSFEGAGEHWIRFSLSGSAPALARIGALSKAVKE